MTGGQAMQQKAYPLESGAAGDAAHADRAGN